MPTKTIPSVRISAEMFAALEDIHYDQRFASRSECVRQLLTEGLAALSKSRSPIKSTRFLSGSSRDISVDLPDDLFSQLEDFRYAHRIPSRAEAIRLILDYVIPKRLGRRAQ